MKKKQLISEEVKRMQKIAGILKENVNENDYEAPQGQNTGIPPQLFAKIKQKFGNAKLSSNPEFDSEQRDLDQPGFEYLGYVEVPSLNVGMAIYIDDSVNSGYSFQANALDSGEPVNLSKDRKGNVQPVSDGNYVSSPTPADINDIL